MAFLCRFYYVKTMGFFDFFRRKSDSDNCAKTIKRALAEILVDVYNNDSENFETDFHVMKSIFNNDVFRCVYCFQQGWSFISTNAANGNILSRKEITEKLISIEPSLNEENCFAIAKILFTAFYKKTSVQNIIYGLLKTTVMP